MTSHDREAAPLAGDASGAWRQSSRTCVLLVPMTETGLRRSTGISVKGTNPHALGRSSAIPNIW